jgi:spermidine/putrescine transport system ATP-binding protein
VDEADHAVITTEDLPLPIYLDHGVTGAHGSDLWVALRPEKIELHKRIDGQPAPMLEDTPSGHNAVAGTIRQIAYLGSESVYEVELENGRKLKALRSNLTRRDQEDFTWDEPVWLAWHACSPAVLLS